MEKEKFKEKKFVTYLWASLKILIFLSFLYSSWVMFKVGNTIIATLILYAVSFFIIFNKIDSMDKRIREME